MIFFVALEGVNVEHRVFPDETRGLQGVLDRVALGVVGSDDLEFFPVVDITPGNFDDGFHFSFVLSCSTSA